jgi:hypothetical protein
MIVDGIRQGELSCDASVPDLVIYQDRSTSLPETYLWRMLDTRVWYGIPSSRALTFNPVRSLSLKREMVDARQTGSDSKHTNAPSVQSHTP